MIMGGRFASDQHLINFDWISVQRVNPTTETYLILAHTLVHLISLLLSRRTFYYIALSLLPSNESVHSLKQMFHF